MYFDKAGKENTHSQMLSQWLEQAGEQTPPPSLGKFLK
jgi:hypothetical protein